jgi:hypothetical protein
VRVRARGDRMAIVVLMACVATCVRVHGVCVQVGRVYEPSVACLGVDDVVSVQASCRSRWSSRWCAPSPAYSVWSHSCCGGAHVRVCVGVHRGGTSGVRLERWCGRVLGSRPGGRSADAAVFCAKWRSRFGSTAKSNSGGLERSMQQGAQSSGRPILVESCGSWREDRGRPERRVRARGVRFMGCVGAASSWL